MLVIWIQIYELYFLIWIKEQPAILQYDFHLIHCHRERCETWKTRNQNEKITIMISWEFLSIVFRWQKPLKSMVTSTQADTDQILLNLLFSLNEATNTFALFTFYQKQGIYFLILRQLEWKFMKYLLQAIQ